MPMSSPEQSALLSVRAVTKSFGARRVLTDVSFDIMPGEFVGLIGANGAGKTTLLRCLSGQLQIEGGAVRVCGLDLRTDPVAAKRALGFAIEPDWLPLKLTGRQTLEFVAGAKSLTELEPDVLELAAQLEILPRLDEVLGTYSRGMLQKIGILCALTGKPRLVLLDESLNALDPVSAFRLKQYLREAVAAGTMSVLLSSHAIETVERIASRVLMLSDGQLQLDLSRAELDRLVRESGKTLEEIFVERIARSAADFTVPDVTTPHA
jgi:ABC-2 type transport system ATP-binding protein